MSSFKVWISAFRLRTLPLAFSSILMGSFIAAYHHSFQWIVLCMALMTTLFLQILSNLANDYGDTINGADHEGRQGPRRTVQSGVISLKQMKNAIILFALLSFISGIILLHVSFGNFAQIRFLLFILLGIVAIGAAMRYTMGNNPYGYKGLGDIYVFAFFGLVGVGGTYFLHTGLWNWSILLPAIAIGTLSTGVLNVNNMRDIESDKEAGKQTLVVRIGLKRAKTYHFVLIGLAITSLFCFVIITPFSWHRFTFMLALPILFIHIKAIKMADMATGFDRQLKKLALSTLITVILFGIGLILN